jgi:hypothetical protein
MACRRRSRYKTYEAAMKDAQRESERILRPFKK